MNDMTVNLYDGLEGAGFEGTVSEDISIPYLRILQSQSTEVRKGVRSAKPGDLFLSSIGTIYKEVSVIPCFFCKQYIERTMGGGLGIYVTTHANRDIFLRSTRSEDGKYDVLPNGNRIIETAMHLVLINDPKLGELTRASISFASTQRKKSRAWLATMGSIKWPALSGGKVTPPMFSHQYILSSKEEVNGANSWYGWVIGPPVPVTSSDIAAEAKAFYIVAKEEHLRNVTPTQTLEEDSRGLTPLSVYEEIM